MAKNNEDESIFISGMKIYKGVYPELYAALKGYGEKNRSERLRVLATLGVFQLAQLGFKDAIANSADFALNGSTTKVKHKVEEIIEDNEPGNSETAVKAEPAKEQPKEEKTVKPAENVAKAADKVEPESEPSEEEPHTDAIPNMNDLMGGM